MTAFFVIANWDVNRANSLVTIPSILTRNTRLPVIINGDLQFVSGDSTKLAANDRFVLPGQRNVTITILPQIKTGLPPGAYMNKLSTYSFTGPLIEPLNTYFQPLTGSFTASFRTSTNIDLAIRFSLIDAVTQVELDGIEKYVIKVDVPLI